MPGEDDSHKQAAAANGKNSICTVTGHSQGYPGKNMEVGYRKLFQSLTILDIDVLRKKSN